MTPTTPPSASADGYRDGLMNSENVAGFIKYGLAHKNGINLESIGEIKGGFIHSAIGERTDPMCLVDKDDSSFHEWKPNNRMGSPSYDSPDCPGAQFMLFVDARWGLCRCICGRRGRNTGPR